MGFLDTFSRKFGFTTDEDDDNEMGPDDSEIEEDDDEDDEEEESGFSFRFPSNPFKRKNAASTSRRRPYEEEEEDEPAPTQVPRSARSNVIHDPRINRQAAEPVHTHCERIVNVRQIEECRGIIQCLLRGESILLNLENIDPKDCGRVVDLLSGAAFALQGRMIKVAHLSYLLAPENVEVIEGEVYADPQARYR